MRDNDERAGAVSRSLVDTETVSSFLDRIAARTPAPGGGGACAVSIGMAAALVAMVARYSTKQLPNAEQLAEAADALRAEALPLVDADATAYEALLTAFRDKSPGYEERVRMAAEGAAEVPLRMTDIAARLAQIAAALHQSNTNLQGDLAIAATICYLTAASAGQLVDLNVEAGDLDEKFSETADANLAAVEDALDELDDLFPDLDAETGDQ
ncbi:MAG: hypothetical protein GEV07_10950 [Streptosporangiales bacterium]|nr:hypothetical protein [Streptosporangiales bacterium]